MAIADQPPAPGRPGAGDSTEIRTVVQFLDQFYEVVPDLDDRVDAAALHRQILAWADERTLPPPGRSLTYAAVRRQGIPVQRGHGNRLQIRGLRERLHARHELARLEGAHHHLHLAATATEEHRTMTRDVQAQARSLAEEAIAALLSPAFEAVRAGLVDPDIRVRLQASEAVLSRCVPKVKVKETTEEPIDVLPIENRPALVEVMVAIEAQQAKGAQETTQG